METLIGLIVFGAILFLSGMITNYKFNHRLPPEGYETDYGAINRDLVNGKFKMDVVRKANNGDYNVPK